MGRVSRIVVAVLLAVPLGLVAVGCGVFAAAVIVTQALAGFVDLSQASWSAYLDPAVWVGWRSAGGTGGPIDAVAGGAGAPGGTFGRYVSAMISGIVAGCCAFGVRAVWHWALGDHAPAGMPVDKR